MVVFFKGLIRNSFRKMIQINNKWYNYYKFQNYTPRKNEIIFIDPRLIAGHLGSSPIIWKYFNSKTGGYGETIVGGEWDKKYVKYFSFTDQEVYKSCYDHWINGKTWEETPFFQKYVKRLEGNEPNRFSSYQELKKRYYNLDKIFNNVYNSRKMSLEVKDLVKISISRDGRLIWGPDGKHRICIALCLGLNKIPARVGFIHVDAIQVFQKIRNNVDSKIA